MLGLKFKLDGLNNEFLINKVHTWYLSPYWFSFKLHSWSWSARTWTQIWSPLPCCGSQSGWKGEGIQWHRIIYCKYSLPHTTSFWNIIIQRTSHDDLTEKLVSLVSSSKLVKWQNVKLHFVIWQKNCLCLTSLDE